MRVPFVLGTAAPFGFVLVGGLDSAGVYPQVTANHGDAQVLFMATGFRAVSIGSSDLKRLIVGMLSNGL